MIPVEITRDELAWALTAVIPHAGSAARELDWIGLEADPFLAELLVFATDSLTVGVAKAHLSHQDEMEEGQVFYLTVKEAKDLLQYIRPNLVAEKAEVLQLLVAADELHVAQKQPSEGGRSQNEPLSGVWSVRVPGAPFQAVWEVIERTWARTRRAGHFVVPGKSAQKFARAERDGDVLNVYPAVDGDKTAAVVTVGLDFIGAVAGIAASHHTAALAEWGLLIEEAA